MPPAPPNRYFRFTVEDTDRQLVYDLALEEDYDTKLTAVLIREGSQRTLRKAPLDEQLWAQLWEVLHRLEFFTLPKGRVSLPARGPVVTIALSEGTKKCLIKFEQDSDRARQDNVREVTGLAEAISRRHFDCGIVLS